MYAVVWKMSSCVSYHHHESRVAFVTPTPNATEVFGTGIPEPCFSFAPINLGTPSRVYASPMQFCQCKESRAKNPVESSNRINITQDRKRAPKFSHADQNG